MENENIENSFNDKLSTKKAYVIIGIFVVSLFSIFAILYKYIPTGTFTNKNNENTIISVTDLVDLDSYTDIKNSSNDSNNNGVEDWREIAAGLDPYQQNDVSGLNINNTEAEKDPDSTANFTELVARDLYVLGQYKEQNPSIDLDLVNTELIKKLESLLLAKKIQLPIINKINTAENNKNYFKYMATLLIYMRSSNQTELAELSSSLDTNYSFEKTSVYAENLRLLCGEYKKVSVPINFVDLHVEAIYLCETYSNILDAILTTKSDPVKSKIAINMYQKNYQDIYNILKLYSQKVKALNIVYGPKDHGSIYYLVN